MLAQRLRVAPETWQKFAQHKSFRQAMDTVCASSIWWERDEEENARGATSTVIEEEYDPEALPQLELTAKDYSQSFPDQGYPAKSGFWEASAHLQRPVPVQYPRTGFQPPRPTGNWDAYNAQKASKTSEGWWT